MKPTARAGRVLVVDEEPKNRELIRDTLEPRGYEVEEAVSGADALTSIAAAPPEAVLLDASMPGLDGLEVCRRLKADALTSVLPVTVVTARWDRRALPWDSPLASLAPPLASLAPTAGSRPPTRDSVEPTRESRPPSADSLESSGGSLEATGKPIGINCRFLGTDRRVHGTDCRIRGIDCRFQGISRNSQLFSDRLPGINR